MLCCTHHHSPVGQVYSSVDPFGVRRMFWFTQIVYEPIRVMPLPNSVPPQNDEDGWELVEEV